jgi:beta-glucanase (GH16 family)
VEVHRRSGRGRIRALVGAVVAVLLAAAITGIVVRHAWIGTSSADMSAKRPDPAKAAASSGLPIRGRFHLSVGTASAAPTASATSSGNPSAGSSLGAASTESPPGSTPGWQLVYSQDFSGSTLPPDWGAYKGQPGGDPYGQWDPADVVVSGGALHLLATPDGSGGYSTGGVMFYGNPQTYGMYLVRMKGDYEPGLQISDVALLWPNSSVWPPEIDFYEDQGGTRASYLATVHPGPSGDNSDQVHDAVDSDGTQWHTYGVQWTPTSITFTIDGQPAGAAVLSSGLPAWPNIPMNLALQSQNVGPAQPGQSIETMTVAWVAEYAMN